MRWRVFYSYSHKDAELRDQLATYLAPLKHQKRIEEWYDRRIEPGADWQKEISETLDAADLILLLVSADFLASDYCFGVEIETALARLKRGQIKVVPVLLKPCLWQESRFSELQFVPRDARPITSWTSREEAFLDVATEIRKLVAEAPQAPRSDTSEGDRFAASLDLVQRQVLAYARLYDRTRQRMPPSNERTARMEQVLVQMRALATASYPFLDDLARSPSPGERLAAVAILQVFADERYLPFLVELVALEKPFVCYHALKALHFAVGALDVGAYPQLVTALESAAARLKSTGAGSDTGRHAILRDAQQQLRALGASLATPEQDD